MKPPKKVRGILDLLQVEENEEWEIDQALLNLPWVLQQASQEDLIRWTIKGYYAEALENLEKAIREINPPQLPGRPKKRKITQKSSARAFLLWMTVNKINPSDFTGNLTNRSVINHATELEASGYWKTNYFDTQMTESRTIEQSVSRGKQELEIDKSWHSDVCEKIYQGLFAND